MKDSIIILGAGVLQGPAILLANASGLETYALDGNANAPHAESAAHFVHIDLKDKDAILRFAADLKKKCGMEGSTLGIMTAGTDFSASVAYTAERLSLVGHSYEAALNSSDKARMRAVLAKALVPQPAFAVIEVKSSASSVDMSAVSVFIGKEGALKSPLVVKPCDNMGGRGCSRVDTALSLEAAIKDAAAFSRTRRVIVEEYMEGAEFSIDALVFDGKVVECGFADRHIYFPPYFIEMGHTIPSKVSSEDKARIMEVFVRGVKALGLTAGAAKGDIKLTKEGPRVGEIAARLSGGYMSGWTYPLASGIEVTKGAIDIAMGKAPTLLPHANTRMRRGVRYGTGAASPLVCAERAYISIPGVVSSVSAIDSRGFLSDIMTLRSLPYVEAVFPRVEAGDTVVFPRNNVEKSGNIIALAPTYEEAARAAEEAARRVAIRLQASNAETAAFLASHFDTTFPPSAFSVPREAAARLAAMPEANWDGVTPPTLLAFPELDALRADLHDYAGRTIDCALSMARSMTGFALEIVQAPTANTLTGGFWLSFFRGGYQGAAYYIDNFKYGKLP